MFRISDEHIEAMLQLFNIEIWLSRTYSAVIKSVSKYLDVPWFTLCHLLKSPYSCHFLFPPSYYLFHECHDINWGRQFTVLFNLRRCAHWHPPTGYTNVTFFFTMIISQNGLYKLSECSDFKYWSICGRKWFFSYSRRSCVILPRFACI